jgi:hypothetical protein
MRNECNQESGGEMSDKLLQAAHAALDAISAVSAYGRPGTRDVEQSALQIAADSLRTAIEQAQTMEPILWMTPQGEGWRLRWEPPLTDVPLGWTPLYTEPRPAPPRQELMDALADNESAYQRGYMDGRAVRSTNPLTDTQIEKIRTEIFSTDNPYCPVDRKSMRKVAKAIESAHDIKEQA